MARGKGGSEAADPRLDGKPYKEALQQVVDSTPMKISDLEDKAFDLLDVLQERGLAEEACDYLQRSLIDLPRAHVQKWRRYTYTLLRRFDGESYAAMKEGRGETMQTRDKIVRASVKKARAAARVKAAQASEASETTPHGALTPGPLTQASPGTSPKSPGTVVALLEALGPLPSFPKAVSTDRAPPPPPPFPGLQASPGGAAAVFKPSAEEFVPGKPWAGAASLRPDAPSFLPTQTWQIAGPMQTPSFRPAAPEFVPGRPVWSLGGSAASTGAKPQRGRPLKQEAAEFVPGQPAWSGAAALGSPSGKSPKAKSGKDNKKSMGNLVTQSLPAALAGAQQKQPGDQPARPPPDAPGKAKADDEGSKRNGSTVDHAEKQIATVTPLNQSSRTTAVEAAVPPAPMALPQPPAAPEGNPAELVHVEIEPEDKITRPASQNAPAKEKGEGDSKILLAAAVAAAAAGLVLYAWSKRRTK